MEQYSGGNSTKCSSAWLTWKEHIKLSLKLLFCFIKKDRLASKFFATSGISLFVIVYLASGLPRKQLFFE